MLPGSRSLSPAEEIPAGAPKICKHHSMLADFYFFVLHSSLFTIHSYLFRQQGNDLPSCPVFGPLLFFSAEKKRSAPGWRRRRGFGANLASTVLQQEILLQSGNRSAIWCRLAQRVHRKPLPLTWCSQRLAGFPRAPGERQRKEKLDVSRTSPGRRFPQGPGVSVPDRRAGPPAIPRRRQEVCACADRPAEHFFFSTGRGAFSF